jgi:hypothetical protein
LADGQRQLVQYLRLRVASVKSPKEKVRVWIDAVMAQARDKHAAEATRPFAINGSRLAARFPKELAASRAELVDTLSPAIEALGGSRMSAAFVCDLALARMSDAIARGRRPHADEVAQLVAFCVAGSKRGG